jgi:hypothetical protein
MEMFLLYNGNEGYSPEAIRVNKVHNIKADLLLRSAARIIRSIGQNPEAAAKLESLPFEIWEAQNGYGDRFDILYMKVPLAKYLEIERTADSYQDKEFFQIVARAMQEAGNPVRFIGMEANADGNPESTVSTPLLETTSLAVSRALNDFETLVKSSGGPASGVDRIHTALHGYLRVICNEASITFAPDADISALFAQIRKCHPKFQTMSPDLDGVKILRGLAGILDALNPVRNRHSMAHPNEVLLAEPEAQLAINAAKTILHYLESKL